MDKRFAPKPGRFGIHPVMASAANVGSVTANTTTTFFLAFPPGKYYINKGVVVCNTVGADSDGVITAILYKYDGAANAAVALCSAVDLEALTTKETSNITITATLTDAQRIVNTDNGDSLYVVVTNDSAAINTQPTNLCFGIELALLQ